jgi:hypothetical protein
MKNLSIALALVLGMSTSALALNGFDGDNHPVPGASGLYAPHAAESARQAPWSIDGAFASTVQDERSPAPAVDGDANPIPGAR